MEQTTCCQTDVESIMRRLRGQQTPYTSPKIQPTTPQPLLPSSEIVELKTIIKTLGSKLQDAYRELADSRTALSSLEQANKELFSSQNQQHEAQESIKTSNNGLKATVEKLTAALLSKDQEISSKAREVERAQLTVEQLEREIVELRSKQANPQPSADLIMLREELIAIRSEQLSWQEERKRLETSLEQERLKSRSEASTNNSQLVRLAMSTKQLEEEVHSLKCERAATLRQFTQLKDLNEETKKTLERDREKLKQREEALVESTATLNELIEAIETQKKAVEALTVEKENAAHKEATLLSQISTLNSSLLQEKATSAALSISLKEANDSFHSLSLQLEQERHLFRETTEKCTLLIKEKETAENRVKEVEELLITKLQAMSDLEEQLGEAISRGDDFEHKAEALGQKSAHLTDDLEKMTQSRDELHERSLQLEQQVGRLSTENAELKKRTEAMERVKKSIAEASAHAHAILRTLDYGPRASSSVSQISEELSVKPLEHERSLFEERFEQHELF